MRSFRPVARTWLPALVLLAVACDRGDDAYEEVPLGSTEAEQRIGEGPHPLVALHVDGYGTLRIELLPEIAPETAANFLKLVREGFYDGTTFHRVIEGFVIQGGDPNSKDHDPRNDGKGHAGYMIQDEWNDFPQIRGVVSMAHSGPGSASSQFFIVHRDARPLDGGFAAFGRVVEGMDVVDAIASAKVDVYGRYGPKHRPWPDPVVVSAAWVERAGGLGSGGALAAVDADPAAGDDADGSGASPPAAPAPAWDAPRNYVELPAAGEARGAPWNGVRDAAGASPPPASPLD